MQALAAALDGGNRSCHTLAVKRDLGSAVASPHRWCIRYSRGRHGQVDAAGRGFVTSSSEGDLVKVYSLANNIWERHLWLFFVGVDALAVLYGRGRQPQATAMDHGCT